MQRCSATRLQEPVIGPLKKQQMDPASQRNSHDFKVHLPPHRKALMCKMIEVAQQHGRVLQARWRLVDEPDVPVPLHIVQDQPQDSIVRVVVSLADGASQTLTLHWPLQSGALFETFNQAAHWLAAAQRNVAAGTSDHAPGGAGAVLSRYIALRAEAVALQLLLDGRPVLSLDRHTDHCQLLAAAAPEAIVQQIRSGAEASWSIITPAASAGERRSGADFLWLLAEGSAEQGLLPEFKSSLLTLRGWPAQAVRGPTSWMRIMNHLRQGSCSVADLAAAVQPPAAELAWFLNGCLATDHVRLRPAEQPSGQELGSPPASVLVPGRSRFRHAISAIRQALGMSRPESGRGPSR